MGLLICRRRRLCRIPPNVSIYKALVRSHVLWAVHLRVLSSICAHDTNKVGAAERQDDVSEETCRPHLGCVILLPLVRTKHPSQQNSELGSYVGKGVLAMYSDVSVRSALSASGHQC